MVQRNWVKPIVSLYCNMPRKTKDVRRKGKDKAREHFDKCGKYDGKSVRRIEAYLDKVKLPKDPNGL